MTLLAAAESPLLIDIQSADVHPAGLYPRPIASHLAGNDQCQYSRLIRSSDQHIAIVLLARYTSIDDHGNGYTDTPTLIPQQ